MNDKIMTYQFEDKDGNVEIGFFCQDDKGNTEVLWKGDREAAEKLEVILNAVDSEWLKSLRALKEAASE